MTYRPTRRQVTALAVVVAAIVLPPLLSRLIPGVFTDARASMLGIGVTYAAMALSLNLLMGYAGQISLGHGALLATGAYTSGILTGRYGWSYMFGVMVAMVMGAAIAFIVGLPALRLRGIYLAITTLGFAAVMDAAILKIPYLSRGSAGVELPRPVANTFIFTENADYLALILVITTVVWLLDANVVRTKLGRAFFGIREDERVAQSFGVDVARYKMIAFMLSGALAGLAGAMHGHLLLFVESRTFAFPLFSLTIVAFVVIGGLGSRVGVVVAAASFGVVPQLLRAVQGWDLILGSALLIFAMARHPGGVAGAIAEAREKKEIRAARRQGEEDDASTQPLPDLAALPLPISDTPTATSGPLLEVRDIHVTFGGLKAVDGADLVVPEGKIIGLIGPNGAGKTTLFNTISGFVTPDAGVLKLRGNDIGALAPHQRAQAGLGRTFQLVGLAKRLSVHQNLLLAQHARANYGLISSLAYLPRAGRTEADLEARATEALEAIGFAEFADRPIDQLSGGQQRIVEIACALMNAPDLLMLDEPSAGMAPGVIESLALRLRQLRDELGRTILIIEHHIPLVMDVCDEVWVMASGRTLAHGSPQEVIARTDVIEAYLGAPTLAGVGGVPRSAAAGLGRPAARGMGG
ncbi:MAG TPA: branched-chain amino acid ABC transporter ATP-binding protein/permease [Acidimicrobiales bacterium]|nr:branched-chain amino acid ABC transporter ATP-binding protein/permease [Acidimicrobiales bacterium]